MPAIPLNTKASSAAARFSKYSSGTRLFLKWLKFMGSYAKFAKLADIWIFASRKVYFQSAGLFWFDSYDYETFLTQISCFAELVSQELNIGGSIDAVVGRTFL